MHTFIYLQHPPPKHHTTVVLAFMPQLYWPSCHRRMALLSYQDIIFISLLHITPQQQPQFPSTSMFASSSRHPSSTSHPAHKILSKQPSLPQPFFFSCTHICSSTSSPPPATRPAHPKISIKSLTLQQGQSFRQEESHSRSKSKQTKISQKTSIRLLKTHKPPQPPPHNSTQTLTHLPQHSESPQVLAPTHQDLTVHNFHTTNYVVGQCLLQPQQTSFIFEDHSQINATIEDELNSILDNNEQQQITHIPNSTQGNSPHSTQGKTFHSTLDNSPSSKGAHSFGQELRPYANFSFGQHQKQQILSKYLHKLHPHHNSKTTFELYELDANIQAELNKLNQQERNCFLRDTFQRKSLDYLVGKVGKTIHQSESEHTDSYQSMVIDTHKSIIEKARDNQIHLLS